MNIYACFCDVGHRADGVYVAKSKKLKGWGIVFCKRDFEITKQYTYNGAYYDDFEGENYQKIVNILQTDDWEILASDRS